MRLLKKDIVQMTLGGIATGISATLSLEPFNINLLIWIALWPLFYFGERYSRSGKRLLLSGGLAAVSFTYFALYWIVSLFQVYGGLPLPVAILAIIPYALLLNIKIPLFVYLYGVSRRPAFRRFARPAWLSAAMIGLFCDLAVPQIFPWYWGNGLAGNSGFIQIAEVTGIHGLTLFLFAGSYILYRIFMAITGWTRHSNPELHRATVETGTAPDQSGISHRSHRLSLRFSRIRKRFRRLIRNRSVLRRIAITPALLLLWYTGGTARRIQMEQYQKGLPTVRVANLQTNAPLDRAQEQLVTPEVIHRIVYRTVPRLAEEADRAAGGKVDLFVLPEAGIPFLTTDRNSFTEQAGIYSTELDNMLRMIAYNYNAEIMLNEVALRAEPGPVDRALQLNAYNTATIFSRDGVRRATYDKMVLVAFGEYIPGVDFLIDSGLIRFLPAAARMGRFTPGREARGLPFSRGNTLQRPELPGPFTLESLTGMDPDAFTSSFSARRSFTKAGTFIPLICYEILFPSHVRGFFRHENPGFMVNITQDGWYGDSIETYQHFELGHVRAVEFRRAIARSTNNGASGYVDIAGNFADPVAGPKFTPRNVETFQVWDVPINQAPPTIFARIGNNWIAPLYAIALLFAGYRWIRRKSA